MEHENRWRRVVKWIALATVLIFFIPDDSSRAGAAEVVDAVTRIVVTEEPANIFADIEFEVEWSVPNGSSSGDFFTVELPSALVAPESFAFNSVDDLSLIHI